MVPVLNNLEKKTQGQRGVESNPWVAHLSTPWDFPIIQIALTKESLEQIASRKQSMIDCDPAANQGLRANQ